LASPLTFASVHPIDDFLTGEYFIDEFGGVRKSDNVSKTPEYYCPSKIDEWENWFDVSGGIW
jgi:hypothetical protein